jgi:hypothetical protein
MVSRDHVGAVLNPGSLQFATGWKAGDNVRAVGGEQRFADAERAIGAGGPGRLAVGRAADPAGQHGGGAAGPLPLRDLGLPSQVALSSAALAVIVRSRGR